MNNELRKSILLHMCCGVCAAASIEKLKHQGFSVIGFFYNPNIHPEDEYIRRLEAAKQTAMILSIPLLEGSYDTCGWMAAVKGLEQEPEGTGSRCGVCFRQRLEETHRKMKAESISCFTTTLSISPHKNAALINRIGSEIGNESFIPFDFKKEDGFKKTLDFSRVHSLYRQRYCGCVFSLNSH
ncbi:MAG: epoxyqueuosine reductase QueH [Candidatus Omnitrophica bacterium]|nr:epoxyqueuosine reductase QueH [Candidatus Omnitrophota bacterium]